MILRSVIPFFSDRLKRDHHRSGWFGVTMFGMRTPSVYQIAFRTRDLYEAMSTLEGYFLSDGNPIEEDSIWAFSRLQDTQTLQGGQPAS